MRIRSSFVRWRGLSLWAVAWSLPLLSSLSGCAGTPWGDSLSGSFPTPPVQATGAQGGDQVSKSQDAEAPSGSPSPGPAAQPGGAARAPSRAPFSSTPGAGGKSKDPEAPKTEAPKSESPKTAPSKPKPPPLATAVSPYRVTIRLPQADPSAPAEGVTEALRMAGIPFEVETIERVAGAAAQSSEASPPGAGPSVRPAPPPR